MNITCKTCRISKPNCDFYLSNKSRCKDCVKESVQRNRIEKIEYYRQYDRMRGSMPHRVSARKEYSQTSAGRMASSRAKRKYSENNPKRRAAHIVVGNAVRDGRLQKLPCIVCGERAQAHHPDYDSPLAVVWLCPPHHKAVHALGEMLTA